MDMKVDAKATCKRLHDAGLTVPGWARKWGFSEGKVKNRFYHGSKFTDDIITALELDDLLVLKEVRP